jgi:hypothetical protein
LYPAIEFSHKKERDGEKERDSRGRDGKERTRRNSGKRERWKGEKRNVCMRRNKEMKDRMRERWRRERRRKQTERIGNAWKERERRSKVKAVVCIVWRC